jgi:hypothetical protein
MVEITQKIIAVIAVEFDVADYSVADFRSALVAATAAAILEAVKTADSENEFVANDEFDFVATVQCAAAELMLGETVVCEVAVAAASFASFANSEKIVVVVADFDQSSSV